MKTRIVEPLRRSNTITRASVFDYCLRAAVPRGGWAYGKRLDPERLERALAQVISDYSVFSGRMILHGRDSLIDFERGCRGVPLELTERPETSLELIKKADVMGADLVAPRLATTPSALASGPLMAARLTHTADGSVLGLAWNHAIGDFHTAVMFLSSWACAYRGESYDAPILVDDMLGFWREHLTDQPGVPSELKVMGFRDIARLTVEFLKGTRRITTELESEDLAALHAAIGTESHLTHLTHLTKEDALWAHVFMALHKLRGTKQPAKFAFAINLRPRIGVPDTVVGNITGTIKVDVDPDDDVTALAAKIRAAIKAPVASHLSMGESLRYAAAHAGRHQRSRYSAVWLDPPRGNLFISSLARFPYERLTFEPGNPMLRMFGSLSDVAMSCGLGLVQPPPGPSGRQIVLWLPPKLAAAMTGEAGRARILAAGGVTGRPKASASTLSALT